MRRKVRFGSIILENDGFDRELYESCFLPENFSSTQGHPANWHAGRAKEILSALDVKAGEISQEFADILKISEITAMSEEQIDVINTDFEKRYCRILEGYETSQGFFTDFRNAAEYALRQERMGINGISDRIHSMVFVRGEGEATIRSKKEGNIKSLSISGLKVTSISALSR